MAPGEAVYACLQDYAKFRGRARRPEFWWWILFILATNALATFADTQVWASEPYLGFSGLVFWLTLLPSLAVRWRRLQDTGIPGWIGLVPEALGLGLSAVTFLFGEGPVQLVVLALYAASAALLTLGCAMPSQSGRNVFGAEPPLTPIRWSLR
ncbi:MAG: DUF805 domain-containing protein [Pseudomonadota bacterium]